MKRIYMGLLILLMVTALTAKIIQVSPIDNYTVEVISSDNEKTVLEFRIGSFEQYNMEIEGQIYQQIRLGEEGFLLEKGFPELPYISRSIVIPDQAKMEVRYVGGEYLDLVSRVAPSKGLLYRNVDPQQVPHSFSSSYQLDEYYPNYLVKNDDPYVFRDFRGLTVRAFPFQYNPVENKLRVYTRMLVEVKSTGFDSLNTLNRKRDGYSNEFQQIYRDHFLNFTNVRYAPLKESGRMLVICYDDFIPVITPFVEWKNQKGIETDLVAISQIGNTPAQIKNFIQTQYNLNNGLTFVQLVGDAAQIATPSVRDGGSDPSYATLDGSDYYPEIFVGRFSAENEFQVTTQVQKTIHYERDLTEENNWFDKATGIASNEGTSPSDIEHMKAIATKLLDYTYDSVDEFYQPYATATQVKNAVNSGRGMINYVGHGTATGWVTSSFTNNHVKALTNYNKLPFIMSVACLNGNFTSTTCFAETWLRAKDSSNGEPIGAIAMYASTVSQSWIPPMTAQNEVADLIVKEKANTFGGLMYNGSSKMIDTWGNGGGLEFQNWHIFGDASLQIRTVTPQIMLASYPDVMFMGESSIQVTTDTPNALVSLTYDNQIVGAGYTGSNGIIDLELTNIPEMPGIMTLTISAFNKVTHVNTIPLSVNEGAYLAFYDLSVNELDQNNSANYNDELTLSLNLKNVGIETAGEVTATLSSSDPYVQINESILIIGDIEPEEVVLFDTAFSFSFKPQIPDQHPVTLTLGLEESDGKSWQRELHFVVNAPVLKLSEMILDDSNGNGNNKIDPGETVILYFPIYNAGRATTSNAAATLYTFDPLIKVVSMPTQEVGIIHPFDTVKARFEISIDESVKPNSLLSLGIVIQTDNYHLQNTYNAFVSNSLANKVEDFATGDFSANNWKFSGLREWTIDPDLSYQGEYSARSGKIIHNQTSTMSITLRIVVSGEISFYKRVSTETGGDFLRFYIDEDKKGEWSGGSNWGKVSYPVDAGTHTFSWTYAKNEMISSGVDAVWVDLITFPPTSIINTPPIAYTNTEILDFGRVNIGESMTKEFGMRNFGSESLNGNITLPKGYSIDNPERLELPFTIRPNEEQYFSITFSPIEAIDYSGVITILNNSSNQPNIEIELTGEVCGTAVDNSTLPTLATELHSNYPNPFNPSTTISFSIKETEEVKIEIYNVLGQKIITLQDGILDQGNHLVTWNGEMNNGVKASSGIYFYRMQTSNYQMTKKMIMLK
jgi:hypothetical protein